MADGALRTALLCGQASWRRVARVTRGLACRIDHNEYASSVGDQPVVDGELAASGRLLATLRVLVLLEPFLQSVSDAVLTRPDLRGVAAWVVVHASSFHDRVKQDAFVAAAVRVSTLAQQYDRAAEYGTSVALSTAPPGWTDRSCAAFILLMHVCGRKILENIEPALTFASKWYRLVTEADVLRGYTDAPCSEVYSTAASEYRHKGAVTLNLLDSLLSRGGCPISAHPLLQLLSTPDFQRACGLQAYVSTTECATASDAHSTTVPVLPLNKPSSMSPPRGLRDMIYTADAATCDAEAASRPEFPRRDIRWTSDFLLCAPVYASDADVAARFIDIHNIMSTPDGEVIGVCAVVAREVDTERYVSFLRRTDASWDVYSDVRLTQVPANEDTFAKYEIALILTRIMRDHDAPGASE